jgi:hypothetical protein
MGNLEARRPTGDESRGCNPGFRRSDHRESSRLREPTSNALEVAREAGAPRRGKVCPKGIRESRQRFSGYPDDYLAPSLFERWRCAYRGDTSTESGAFDGKAFEGVSRTALPGSDAPVGRAGGELGEVRESGGGASSSLLPSGGNGLGRYVSYHRF